MRNRWDTAEMAALLPNASHVFDKEEVLPSIIGASILQHFFNECFLSTFFSPRVKLAWVSTSRSQHHIPHGLRGQLASTSLQS
jgi:hypothetical protein